jgi:hypothetical protein
MALTASVGSPYKVKGIVVLTLIPSPYNNRSGITDVIFCFLFQSRVFLCLLQEAEYDHDVLRRPRKSMTVEWWGGGGGRGERRSKNCSQYFLHLLFGNAEKVEKKRLSLKSKLFYVMEN